MTILLWAFGVGKRWQDLRAAALNSTKRQSTGYLFENMENNLHVLSQTKKGKSTSNSPSRALKPTTNKQPQTNKNHKENNSLLFFYFPLRFAFLCHTFSLPFCLLTMAEVVEALYPFEATSDNGLSFQAGDRIEVVQRDASGWTKGKFVDKPGAGWFPTSYVKVVEVCSQGPM